MATIAFTIPDAAVPRVVDAFVKAYGYQATIEGSPNPETKAQFMRRQLMEFIKNTVQTVETGAASETARAAEMAKSQVDVT